MSSKNTNSYKQIFKATSVFGGVQVFTIIITMLRSKFIAIFLGPAGMGLMTMFTSSLSLISGITAFGLGTSAVKNIAASAEDEERLGKITSVFRRLVWITGGIGFIVTLILSPLLSKIAFGNKEYTISFILLSFTLLFNQITTGQTVLLRGLRKIPYLAKSTMLGAFVGLLFSIPLYYFYGENGIVPSIILVSLISLFFSWLYAKKVKVKKVAIDGLMLKTEGREMLKMGFLISLSGLVSVGFSYVVRIFINWESGIDDVGLFAAGFSIIGTYVGLIFSSMSTDYYPRLSAVSQDNQACKREINHQAEVALIIIAPVLMVFLVFVKLGIVLLYTKEFLGIIDMVRWASLGMFFKTISWSIGFVFLAKGASKLFFINELLSSSYMLILNLIGYKWFGLTGLGISFFIGYFFHFCQMLIVSRKLYNISIHKSTLRFFSIQFLIAVCCFVIVSYYHGLGSKITGVALILISGIYSWKELNAKIDILKMVKKKFFKK